MKKPISAPPGYYWSVTESFEAGRPYLLSLVKTKKTPISDNSAQTSSGLPMLSSIVGQHSFRFGSRHASRKIVRQFYKNKAAKEKLADIRKQVSG